MTQTSGETGASDYCLELTGLSIVTAEDSTTFEHDGASVSGLSAVYNISDTGETVGPGQSATFQAVFRLYENIDSYLVKSEQASAENEDGSYEYDTTYVKP